MKIEKELKPKEFVPFKLTIDIKTEQELKILKDLLKSYSNIPKLQDILRQALDSDERARNKIFSWAKREEELINKVPSFHSWAFYQMLSSLLNNNHDDSDELSNWTGGQ